METFIIIFSYLIAAIFLFSGINKAYFNEKTLVQKGQTGVENLPILLIRFIAYSEIVGAIGLILPMLIHQYEILTTISAGCLGAIMVPAAIIHYKRSEFKSVLINIIILLMCLLIVIYNGF